MAGAGADHLTPGVALPAIALPATVGAEVSIAALTGRSVVAIYPWTGRPGHPNPPDWDDIPGAHGSTPELEGFRDLYQRFAQEGAKVLALSRQTSAWQRELTARLRLPFPILSDEDGRFAEALALPSFVTGGTIYLKRLTLVVREGRIETVFYPVANPADHAADVLAWVEAQA